jgi:hypothetical protein
LYSKEAKMEANQILLTDRDPITLHEERRNPHLESQELNLDERVLNMVRIISHDVRGSLVSMSATLKLLSRGYYGKMEEGVVNCLNELLSKTISLIGITEEHPGRTLSTDDDLETGETDNHFGTTRKYPISVRGNNPKP